MEKEIWQRSKTDTIGINKFYETQKDKHQWKTRVNAVILSSTKMDEIKKALSLLKKNATSKEIKEKLNPKDVVNVMSNDGVYEEGADALPKGIKLQEGISDIIKQGEYYFVVKIDKVLPPGPKTLDECRGKVVNDYQQYLEQNWVDELKKEFTIKVNQDVFENVKNKLKK